MYYNKVEICGVNTSKLTILTDEQKTDLLRRTKAGDAAARQELIYGNLRLVLSIIQRFAGRKENMDDLFQVGCIGLVKAVDNFNIDLDVKFSTYAVPMIIGEIRRYLRDNNTIRISRSIRDLAYRSLQAREELLREHQREPSAQEIADKIGEKKEAVLRAMEAVVEPISLYEPVFNENGDTLYVIDQLSDRSSGDDAWLENIALKEAMRTLSERERNIIAMRFYKNKTRWRSPRRLVSRRRRCRVLKRALWKKYENRCKKRANTVRPYGVTNHLMVICRGDLRSPALYVNFCLLDFGLKCNRFAKDMDLVQLGTHEHQRLIFGILGGQDQLGFFGVIVHALECGLVLNDHSCDLTVCHHVALFDKHDVTVLDACADHAVSLGAQAKIGVQIGARHDKAVVLLVG